MLIALYINGVAFCHLYEKNGSVNAKSNKYGCAAMLLHDNARAHKAKLV